MRMRSVLIIITVARFYSLVAEKFVCVYAIEWVNGTILFAAVLMTVVFVSCGNSCQKLYRLNCISFKGLMAWILPCYVQGKIAEGVGESCCLHCIAALIPYINWYCMANLRSKHREQNSISVSQ